MVLIVLDLMVLIVFVVAGASLCVAGARKRGMVIAFFAGCFKVFTKSWVVRLTGGDLTVIVVAQVLCIRIVVNGVITSVMAIACLIGYVRGSNFRGGRAAYGVVRIDGSKSALTLDAGV